MACWGNSHKKCRTGVLIKNFEKNPLEVHVLRSCFVGVVWNFFLPQKRFKFPKNQGRKKLLGTEMEGH